jgi:hypothetical protein
MARRPSQLGVAVIAATVIGAAPLHAQNIEVVPFGGFRFGSVLVDAATSRPLEVDGAPAVGVTVDVPLSNGMQFEAAFSHQKATIFAPGDALTPSLQSHVTVDHYQAGGLQEYDVADRARPFLTGVLGLTRYGSSSGNEIRFTAGGGGGVKLFPVPRVGVRFDGKVFATFVDAHGTGIACGGRGCLLALHVSVAWQAEFTAGLVFKLR